MYSNNYQQGGYGNQGYNSGPSSFNNDDEFDIDSINPNAEPWEIAQQLSGGERDIGSSFNAQSAFNQAQNMQVNIDTNKSREMFEQTEVTSRGGGGTSWTTTLISGAAGYAAMSYYQNYQRKQGKQVSYGFMKKMVAGIAMAQAVKMFNKQNSGPGFMGMGGGKRDIEQSREVVAAEAAANAMKLVDEQYGPGGNQGGNQGGYGAPQGGNFNNNQSLGGNQPGYGGNQPGYGGSQPSYGGNQYGSNPPPPAGGYNPSFGTDQKTPYGQPQPAFNSGYNPPPQTGYGAPPSNPGYGAPQPPQGFGAPQGNYPPSGPSQGQYGQPPSYNNPGPGGFIDPTQKRY